MVYTFEILKHANIRYRDAVGLLSRCELLSMLGDLSVSCDVYGEQYGGSSFLTFECRELQPDELLYLSGHSSVALMAEKQGNLLSPLSVDRSSYLPEDLPEVLKYKGKTSVPFTLMMINTAAALSAFHPFSETLTFFDPVCGKGTGCFCALTRGMNTVGVDIHGKDLKEASDYFARYLKYHKLKHQVRNRSETTGNRSVPVVDYEFADSKEHFQAGDRRTLSLAQADTADSPVLFRRKRAHVIATDLPYGIQHAPVDGKKPENLHSFLSRVLPVWKQVLMPGGAIVLSFNCLTLPSDDVREAFIRSGFRLPDGGVYSRLRHEVEHAVVRDVIFALNPEEES